MIEFNILGGGDGATRTWRNSTETQQSGATSQSLDLKSKMEKVVPKMARRRGSDAV